jgi:hypothetical protein
LKSVILLIEFLYFDKDMLQKQVEYVHPEVLEDELNDPKASIAVAGHDSGFRIEMKKKRIKKTSTIFFAIVTVTALFAVAFIMAPQHASATAHLKAHTTSEDSSYIGIDHSGSTKL